MDDLALLYDKYAIGLYRYARAILGDAAAAEDIVQDAFLQIAKWPRWMSNIRDPERYLRRAVRNGCISTRRHTRARNETPMSDIGASGRPELTCSLSHLDLDEALAQLPAAQREVVYLHLVEGYTFKEIGAFTGAGINTASSRYRYAIVALKRFMTRGVAGIPQ